MASMRRLNRRLLRWRRYADRVAFNPRIVQPWAWQPPRGYQRAAKARVVEWDRRERRWHDVGYIVLGDDEPRCTLDEAAGVVCYCTSREGCQRAETHDDEFFCGDPSCSCGDEPDDDAGHGDDWPPLVVSVPDISEWRLP